MVRAHYIFTLHHGWPLEQLFKKHGRDKFCSILNTYWTRFSANWDVLLHGSPAVDMFNGLKLAAGGELGMGVGEEEWGSSERDVLEDFARRTEGLVDVVVSRFGEASPLQNATAKQESRAQDEPAEPWIGCGGNVAATDGVVFSGVGGLSRSSLRDIANWTEDVYHYGDHAYGIRDNPTSDRRRRRRRNPNAPTRQADPPPAKPSTEDESQPHDSGTGEAPRIPPPIVKAVESSLDKASKAIDDAEGRAEPPTKQETGHMLASLADTDTWVKYMTLGYGTAWGGKKPSVEDAVPTQEPSTWREPTTRREQSPETLHYVEPAPDVDLVEEKRKAQVQLENDGYFLVGLKGSMVQADIDDEDDDENWNARIPLRTVYVEKVSQGTSISESDETPGEDSSKEPSFNTATKLEKSRLRPVVYVVRLPCPNPHNQLTLSPAPPLHLHLPLRAPHQFPQPNILLPHHPHLLRPTPPLPRPQHNPIPRRAAPARRPNRKHPHHLLRQLHATKHIPHLRPRMGPPHTHPTQQHPQHPRPRHAPRRGSKPLRQHLVAPRRTQRARPAPRHRDIDPALLRRNRAHLQDRARLVGGLDAAAPLAALRSRDPRIHHFHHGLAGLHLDGTAPGVSRPPREGSRAPEECPRERRRHVVRHRSWRGYSGPAHGRHGGRVGPERVSRGDWD